MKKKKRLVNLEVDEVSLVDKPAIGEPIYLTKRVGEEGVTKDDKDPPAENDEELDDSEAVDEEDSEESEEENEEESEDEVEKTAVPSSSSTEEEKRSMQKKRAKAFGIEAIEGKSENLVPPSGTSNELKKWGDPVNFKFPLDTVGRVRNAVKSFGQGISGYAEEDSKKAVAERIASFATANKVEIQNTSEIWNYLSQKTRDRFQKTEEAVVEDNKEQKLEDEQLKKRMEKVEKNLGEVETMLAQSLDLHEVVAANLNEILALQMNALDVVMMMIQEDQTSEQPASDQPPSEGEAPTTMASITEQIRGSIKAVKVEISKAGAKISRGRLQLLRDIASKLGELIQSVDVADEAASKVGKKGTKKAEVLKTVQKSFESLTGEIGGLKDVSDELREKLTGIEERLKGVESTAGASDAIDDDDAPEGTSSTSKSVFSGLIPEQDIKRISKTVRAGR